MLEQFLQFWSFNDPNVGWVLCGSVLLGAAAAVIGTFAFLQRKSLAGDALAHAALPGVTTAFLIFQSRSPAVILGGAIVSCIIGYMTVEFLTKKQRLRRTQHLQ